MTTLLIMILAITLVVVAVRLRSTQDPKVGVLMYLLRRRSPEQLRER